VGYQHFSEELKQRLDGLHAAHDFRAALKSARSRRVGISRERARVGIDAAARRSLGIK
jgi:hypothetical protein